MGKKKKSLQQLHKNYNNNFYTETSCDSLMRPGVFFSSEHSWEMMKRSSEVTAEAFTGQSTDRFLFLSLSLWVLIPESVWLQGVKLLSHWPLSILFLKVRG